MEQQEGPDRKSELFRVLPRLPKLTMPCKRFHAQSVASPIFSLRPEGDTEPEFGEAAEILPAGIPFELTP